MSCELIALHLVQRAEREGIDDMTQLKLQKMLYYIQGYHMALYGTKAFSAPIKAYDNGPVVSSFYGVLKEHVPSRKVVTSAILCTALGLSGVLCLEEDLLNISNKVFDELGSKTALELRQMTHEESPWIAHQTSSYPDKADGEEITEMELMDYFSPLVTEKYLASVVNDIKELDESDLLAVPQDIETAEDFLAWMKA
jgi:uncharacterized phage-associated protein